MRMMIGSQQQYLLETLCVALDIANFLGYNSSQPKTSTMILSPTSIGIHPFLFRQSKRKSMVTHYANLYRKRVSWRILEKKKHY